MAATPVIAVFDIGKTNKKLLLFDEQFQVRKEMVIRFEEIADEDGFPCDDLPAITRWILQSLDELLADPVYDLRAVNFSAYGASFVFVDDQGNSLTPLYNYLKPFPQDLLEEFYTSYGDEKAWSQQTASPVLGSLNSGLQLYRLKREKPALYMRMRFALHLPQYFSFLLTGNPGSDITSIGCHTGLWDFAQKDYHHWVKAEGISQKLAPIVDDAQVETVSYKGKNFLCGIGMHDSSAALVPYLRQCTEPFALLSTGTWCITLNPFNDSLLTAAELQADCLCYLGYKSQPVKASRLFAGQEHEQQVERIAYHFGMDPSFLPTLPYDPKIIELLKSKPGIAPVEKPEPLIPSLDQTGHQPLPSPISHLRFRNRDMDDFGSATEAYHQLMLDLVELQCLSSRPVLNNTEVRHLYVDGGFSRNQIFMQLLSNAMPEYAVRSFNIAQASALGAALVLSVFD